MGHNQRVRLLDLLADASAAVRTAVVLAAIGIAAGLAWALHTDVQQTSLFLLVAVVVAAVGGRTAGLCAAVLAALVLNVVFTEPRWTLRVGTGDDLIALVTFGAVAVVVGSVVARMATLRDAAEQRADEADGAARQRIAAEAEAERARSEAEISRTRAGLLSAVSHNLRTPLAAIQTATSVLLDPSAHLGADERVELLGTVHDESGRLGRMVAKLLDLGRIRAGGLEIEPAPADIEGLCQAVVHRLAPLLALRPVRVDVEPAAQTAEVDPGAFEQILTNLLENALRYTPESSPIEITGRRVRGALELCVVDHGPGVDPDDAETIFEEFRRGEERTESEGTGLGLAIVKALVIAHRGRVGVQPTRGGGATFVVRVPMRFER